MSFSEIKTRTSGLEPLCRPILARVCEYRRSIRAGRRPAAEAFRADITRRIAEARESAGKVPGLGVRFAAVERPLVFFIDYMVKDGGFALDGQWRELARDYNELSGDEKFFDMLETALADAAQEESESGEQTLSVFGAMIGLGFDGMFKGDPQRSAGEMSRIRALTRALPDFSGEALTPEAEGFRTRATPDNRLFIKASAAACALAAIFFAAALGINAASYANATADYRNALGAAQKSAETGAHTAFETEGAKNASAP